MPTGSIALPVIFIDADGFKQINDVYSHETGDQALVLIAETLKQNLRSNDILGRFSGDEFIVFLPYTNKTRLCHSRKKLEKTATGFLEKDLTYQRYV